MRSNEVDVRQTLCTSLQTKWFLINYYLSYAGVRAETAVIKKTSHFFFFGTDYRFDL